MPLKLWSVEGNRQRLDGGAMFGNVPRALWQKWIPPDERHRIPLACRGLLVENLNGMKVLFETGIGAFFEPKLKDRFGVVEDDHVLLRSLKDRGTSHEEIDAVVLSHLHFDHAGGLLSAHREGAEPTLLFPKAKFLIGEKAWQRARAPHFRDRASFIPALQDLLKASGRLEIVTGDASPTLGEQVHFNYSQGHTPGLLLSEIGGDGGVVFCADLIPGRPWVHLPITMGYDRYPEALIDEKSAFLEDKLARGVRLFFTHDPQYALASVAKNERGAFTTANEMRSVEGLSLG
jgi:glyoxylase-like metal-dependent hydrolase (beta-lactamase superfamily II)